MNVCETVAPKTAVALVILTVQLTIPVGFEKEMIKFNYDRNKREDSSLDDYRYIQLTDTRTSEHPVAVIAVPRPVAVHKTGVEVVSKENTSYNENA